MRARFPPLISLTHLYMPLYAFIYILLYFSFILKIVICTHLYYRLLYYCLYYIIIVYCLSYAKSKLYILYLSHTRAGFGWLGRFWGVFGGSGGFYPSNGRFLDGRRAFGAACGRVRACFPVRAGVRGCTPAIFRARPTPARLPSHSVRRICGGVSRGVRVSASECVYCIIFSA